MADERIEDISGGELTAPAPADLFVMLDASDTTDDPQGTTKRIKYENMLEMSIGATKTASFTAAVGELYPVSIASLGANLDVTFPSTPAAGDTFGFFVAIENTTDSASSSFNEAPFWGAEPVASTSINDASYSQASGDGVGKWGLMIDGEILIFRYDAVNATWMVVEDGRICMKAQLRRNATQTLLNQAYDPIEHDTQDYDVGGIAVVSSGSGVSGEIDIKRANPYLIWHRIALDTDALYDFINLRLKRDSTSILTNDNYALAGSLTIYVSGSRTMDFAAGELLEHDVYQDSAGTNPTLTDDFTDPVFGVVEIL